MPISNYSDLRNAVQDFLNRQDLAIQAQTFIQLFETDANRTLRIRDGITGPVTISFLTDTASLPADFLELKGAPTFGDAPLAYRTPEELSAALANLSLIGDPSLYSIVGKNMRIAPMSPISPGDPASDISIFYYQRVTPLAEPTDTNWLLQLHPDLYLYGALLQSAPYLKDDDRIGVWNGFRQQILEDIRIADERSSYRGATPVITPKGGSIGAWW